MDISSVASELYGLSPAEFVAARDAKAAEARQAGDKQLAAVVKKLKRPAPAAWLANLLTRRMPQEIGELLALGTKLRDAQQRLSPDELRSLSRQGRRQVSDLLRAAKSLAASEGQPASAAVIRQLEETLDAALADPDAADAVKSGQIVAPLSYAGLGTPIADDAATWAGGERPVKASEDTEAFIASAEKRLTQLRSELEDAKLEGDQIRQQLGRLALEAEDLRNRESAVEGHANELQTAIATMSADIDAARRAST